MRLTPAGRDAFNQLAPHAEDADAQLLAAVQGIRPAHLRSAFIAMIGTTAGAREQD